MPIHLIDAYNFLHAVVLKGHGRANWWSAENQARVVAAVVALGARREAFAAWVVFDRRGMSDGSDAAAATPVRVAPGVEVHSAPDADDYIVARCAELSGCGEVCVVTADRSLGDRARRHGARRLSPWAFAAGESAWFGGGEPRGKGRTRVMDETTEEERFVRLEVKCAYLEKLALDLNEVVIAQGQLIEELGAKLDRVERQLRAGPDDEPIPHERPPHY